MIEHYYQVAVDFPKAASILTYAFNEELPIGSLVAVPLGRRQSEGVVLSEVFEFDFPKEKIKALNGIIPNSFSMSKEEIELYQWMAKYYHYPVGKLIFDCIPKILKRPRAPEFMNGDNEPFKHELTLAQKLVVKEIADSGEGFSQHYVHGVTGSGKSLVFLELIKKTLSEGKSVQFLLPEINLTPQFVELFKKHLDCKILSYHSGVTPSEKFQIWNYLKKNNTPVLAMGVRSSVFLPIQNLGLIIIDEEHDASFKQTDRCPYQGRDVAIKKAQLNGSKLVMGSATPTVENFFQFSSGNQGRHYYSLPNRVGDGAFPRIKLFDIRGEFSEDDPTWPLLPKTIESIERRLEKKEQVLIFINKLGFSHFVQCRHCGHQFKNENCGCDNNLRYFKAKNLLSCAHCEYKAKLPDQCPECGSLTLMNKGFGTEKVEEVLKKLLPNYCVERFDREEITNFNELKEKLDRFHSGEINVLVGTQMLSKGHNFEKVNLVVVLGIDAMLGYADFRSTEKTYQMLQQVSGRAGRFSNDSEVVIQTMNPEHSLFKLLQDDIFDGFYKSELPLRELCHCPPFTKLAMMYVSARERDILVPELNKYSVELRRILQGKTPDVSLLGPAPMSIEKKANHYTWALMFKSNHVNQLHQSLAIAEACCKFSAAIHVKFDIDPVTIL